VVGTPKVERDTDDDTITYSFRAEPAGFHEMIEDLKMSYFHGHYAEVPPRPCVALVRVEDLTEPAVIRLKSKTHGLPEWNAWRGSYSTPR
jgi:hypothetical protein